MSVFLQNLGVGIVVAFVSAIATVHFALKRFRAERWWDRKAAAYQALIEALHHIKSGTEDDLRDFLEHPRSVDDEREKQLLERYRNASDEIRKAMDLCPFLLSSEAETALLTLQSEREKARQEARIAGQGFDAVLALEGDLVAIKGCLKRFPDIAKRDLGVKG